MTELRKRVLSLPGKFASFVAGTGLGSLPLLALLHGFAVHYLKPTGIVLVEVQGSKMYLDSRDIGIAPYLLEWGVYEKFETALFKSVVKKDMTIVDIGANIGYYTLLASKLVGKEGRVYAFEPDPHNYGLLLRNIRINSCKNVIPVQKAVSDQSGKQSLFLDKINLGAHSLSESNVGTHSSVIVHVTTLDDFFRKIDCKVDIVKMDVQGSEMKVLAGMTETINANVFLQIITEFWPLGLKNFGSSPVGFLKKLSDFGFAVYEIKKSIEPVSDGNFSRISERREQIALYCAKQRLVSRIQDKANCALIDSG